ncbi:uncharacterized protein LOC143292431 [Babylonia areolata]|uniref:uncharacterized protein LOC143292431 n=1 Tax=Babylonia areolata TaxID=304850 RepID=UPI003FD1BB74
MMEVTGAKEIWTRSVEKHKFRYTTMLSDGDCKTYNELVALNPYDTEISKEECINHVSKRLGTALRNLVSDNSKRGVTLGGRGYGKLTQMNISKLQAYYTKAIRSNKTVKNMARAVWASVMHCTSTDAAPHHTFCPQGRQSWCFFNRARARGQPAPRHQGNMNTYISKEIFCKLEPVYRKLADPYLLRRCIRGKIQNANESLHGVIWSRCPKHTFAFLDKVEVTMLLSVGEFNMGSTASHNFMTAQGLFVGDNTTRLGQQRDRSRLAHSRRSQEQKQLRRREKVRQATEMGRRKNLLAENGSAYAPGGF